jgi:hypothetical protein
MEACYLRLLGVFFWTALLVHGVLALIEAWVSEGSRELSSILQGRQAPPQARRYSASRSLMETRWRPGAESPWR